MYDIFVSYHLDISKEFIRLEIETALNSDTRIIPSLLNGAKVPSIRFRLVL